MHWRQRTSYRLTRSRQPAAASVPLPGGKAYLTLQAVWRNPGAVPVRVCPDPGHSFVEQYGLGQDPPVGSFRMAGYPGAAGSV